MMIQRWKHHTRCRAFGVWGGLFVVLMAWTGAWSQGQDLPAESLRQRRPEPQLAVTVHQGQLSADVRGAEVGELLAQIGQQAGIRMRVAPSARTLISAQFVGIALDEGLRRLCRLAALNHTILYTRDPGGTVAIQEVRVFGAEPAGAPVSPRADVRARNEAAPDDTSPPADATPALDPPAADESQEDAPDASR